MPQTSLPQLPHDVDNYILTDLTAWTKYRITVQAVNVVGLGQETSSDVIMRGAG